MSGCHSFTPIPNRKLTTSVANLEVPKKINCPKCGSEDIILRIDFRVFTKWTNAEEILSDLDELFPYEYGWNCKKCNEVGDIYD